MWQDPQFMFWNFAFAFIMLAQVRELWVDHTRTMSRVTLVLTTTGLCYFMFLYSTMGFWLAMSGNALDAVAWSTALVLSERNRRWLISSKSKT